MRGVCDCVSVYVCTCVGRGEGGREGERVGGRRERERCVRCVYTCVCVRVWGRGGREGEM